VAINGHSDPVLEQARGSSGLRERPEASERVPLLSSLARLGELRLRISDRRAFVNHEVYTSLRESYLVTGARFAIATNSGDILTAARNSFRLAARNGSSPLLTMRLWVDPAAQSSRPWPQPYFRRLSHMAYAAFDSENSLIVDLRCRRVVGRFSPLMARDEGYWQRVIFPTIVGFLSDALGITVLHCACAERGGSGLLLAGESGSGKSMLSLALAQSGFAFLSDDWTYLSGSGGELAAWGLVTLIKLLPDAVEHFHELRAVEASVSLNGEQAYEVDPERVFGIRRSLQCEPRWLVFLERREKPGHSLVRMPPREAAARLVSGLERLPPELSQLQEIQRATIQSLVERECWLLRHRESPHTIAQVLVRLCANCPPDLKPGMAPTNYVDFVRRGPDLTRCLTPTPYVADIFAAGRAIRLETNSTVILGLVTKALDRYERTQAIQGSFLWRLVSDDAAGLRPPWPDFRSLSADGLHLANIGQRSFLAIDREARCAIAFIAEDLLKDEVGFEQAFLSRLLSIAFGGLFETSA
jgi:hypothetical protein